MLINIKSYHIDKECMKNVTHPDLISAQLKAYGLIGLEYKNYGIEPESIEYGASFFQLKKASIKFRVAHITPTKVGHFVTFWKRIDHGPIMPYDQSDMFDFLIISVKDGEFFGQFIFPKAILISQNILSTNNVGGKRGFLIYPPWDITINQQAKRTQAWQLRYFAQIQPTCDIKALKQLFIVLKTT